MILVVFIILCLSFSAYSYFKFKTIFHPAFITSTVWIIIMLLYRFFDHGLFDISDKVYIAIGAWVLTFCSSSILFSRIKLNKPKYIDNNTLNEFYVSSKLYYVYIIILIIMIYTQYRIGSSVGVSNELEGMRDVLTEQYETLPMYYKILSRLEVIIYVVFWSAFLCKNDLPISKKKLFILGLLLLVFTFQLATKGKIFEFFLTFLFIGVYYNKIKKKYLIFTATFVIGIIAILSLMRDGVEEMDFLELAIIYILSPVTALNEGLNNLFEPSWNGINTFSFFYTLKESFFGPEYVYPGKALTGWINVPLPTNVYTVIYSYYLDFGYYGIIGVGLMMGTFWGLIFNYVMKGVKAYIIVYSLLYYNLVFQFFGDWFFIMLSLMLQTIFWSLFVFIRFRFKLKN